ncbi:hypothetical protein [Fundicoccus ignavus]|uniref:Uncharacterized protein n=1 Tax=Fundicoccus ignavus TaxID=2664442 RepID=A0A844BVD0_9LACT|nr:hypothetical protein [Fundicoccus ignavus]MRJ46049.1 hypothetical protein [Fundicoccus ignavus]
MNMKNFRLTSVASVIYMVLGVLFNWWGTAWVIIPVAAVIDQYLVRDTQ